MAVNEQIVTGRKFRKLVDEATKAWQRISFWTKAVDVEFNDSKTAETKLGAIDGITDSLASTSSRIAASAKAVSTLNNNLGGLSFYEDASGKYVVGADSVPKKLGSATIKSQTLSSGRLGTSGYTHTFVFDKLSKVSGITSVSAMGYSTPSPNQNNNFNVSISGNRVTLRLAAGYSYYEYTCTAIEVVG